MSGLSLMALGPYVFEAMGFGFTGRSRSQKTPWAALSVAGGMDRAQWAGGGSRTETITGAVFTEFGGTESLEGIKLAARLGTPLTLVDLSAGLANVFGLQVVEEITEDLGPFDGAGAALKVAYSIRLRTYEGTLLTSDPLNLVSLFA